jgi:hypothetical protein
LKFIDKTGPECMRGEFRTVNRQVALGVGLEPPDGVGIESTRNLGPRAARLGEGP